MSAHWMGIVAGGVAVAAAAMTIGAQAPATGWRGAGPPPCTGPDGGIYKCAPGLRPTAVRAGRLFDSRTGRM